EATATDSDAIDAAALAADELEQADVSATTDAVDLSQVRDAVKQLNESMRDFLGPVVAMLRNNEPTTKLGKLRIWGPVTRGATEYRFLLRHGDVHRWGWRLDARVAETNTSWSYVAAGEIRVGERLRRGAGVMGFDLDALHAVDPTIVAKGQVLVGFKHGLLGSSVGYALRNFTRDPTAHAPVDALLRAVHLKDGFNRVRLAYHGNVAGTATDAQELVLARVRHQAQVGGRSDLVAVGGDVPTSDAWVISQCWNKELQAGYRVIRSCPLDGILGERCTVVQASGNADNCPSLLREPELPPADPSAPMLDAEDPNAEAAPPDSMPTVDDTGN
ncbi:MAG TPA: hypothetical protein VIV60_29970, partial [Polyangiaceae bacterium]